MMIDLDKLESDGQKFDVLVKPDDVDLEREDVTIKGDVSLRGEAVKHAVDTEIKGVIAFAADVDCTRCLKPVPSSFLFDFDVDYVSPEHFPEKGDKELLNNEMMTDVSESGRVDLNDLVREQILLNLPEQTLCKDECKGICEQCGADRNTEDCKCGGDDIDPRWAALKNLN